MRRKPIRQKTGFFQTVKRFLLSAFVVFSFILYALHERHPNTAAASALAPTPTGTTDTPVPSQDPAATTGGSTATAGTAPTTTIPPQGQTYKNGTYTGPSVDVFYGNVQVQVTIQNGQIANVTFLQYPNDRRTSQEINSQAMPWLQQEAIQAQSANVDIITGATLTSEGFANSLQAALQSAQR